VAEQVRVSSCPNDNRVYCAALAVALATIVFELAALAWIRRRFFATGFLRSFTSIAIGRVIRSPAEAFLRDCQADLGCEALHHGGISQDVEFRVGRSAADGAHDVREAATPVSPHPAPVFRLLMASAQGPPGASQEGKSKTTMVSAARSRTSRAVSYGPRSPSRIQRSRWTSSCWHAAHRDGSIGVGPGCQNNASSSTAGMPVTSLSCRDRADLPAPTRPRITILRTPS